MPVCDVRTVAADVRSRLQRLLGAGVVAGSSRRLVDMLSSIAVYAAQNPRVNVHLHLTGHDQDGNTFWVPVHEDQQLLDSAAGNVMAMVYRFAESGDAMQHGSDAINPLLNGRTQGGNAASGARRGVETETSPTAVLPTSSAVGANGTTSSGATVGRADHDTLGTGAARPRAAFSTPNAPHHISTAPVGSQGPRLVQTPTASTQENEPASSSAVATSVSRGAGAGLAGDRDAAGRGTLPDASAGQELAAALAGDGGHESSPNDATYVTDNGSHSINEEEDSDDFLMESRYLHSRRRSRVLKAPVSTCKPAPVVPSDATVERVLELLGNNRPKQHVRAVIPLMLAAMRRAGARTVQSMLLTLPWWPRKSTHDVWPMTVIVRNSLLAKMIPAYDVSDGRVTATLKRWLTKRDDPPVERLANVLLLAQMEPAAMEALKSYVRTIKPQPLHEVARAAPRLASLSSLAGLRAGSRVAPTPGELARRRADPRQPGTPFDATPRRPNNWVATGSNPPTHHPSRMPPPPVPGHSLLPSGGAAGAAGSGGSAASPVTASDSAEAFDAQSVTAALLAAQRVIDSCAPPRIADSESRSGAAGGPAIPSSLPPRRTRLSHATLSTDAAASPAASTSAAPASAPPRTAASPPATEAAAVAPSAPPRPAASPPATEAAAVAPSAPPRPEASPPAAATPATAASSPPRPAASLPATDAPAAAAAASAPPQPKVSPSAASTPAAAAAAHAPPQSAPSTSAATRPSCAPSARPPAASPPAAGRPAGHPTAGSRPSSPAPSPSGKTTTSPPLSLPPDTPPPGPCGQLPEHHGSSSQRTVSWADAVGHQGSSGAAAGLEKTRASGAVSQAEKLKGGVGPTAGRTGAVGTGRLLSRDHLGKTARVGVGRRSFGSGRALAQVEAAVAGVAATAGSASASSIGDPRSPLQPPSAPVSPAAAFVSSVPELPVQPPRTFTGTRRMRLRSSADSSSTPTATPRPMAEVPATYTANIAGGKRVVAAVAGDEAKTELVTKKRRVGMRSSASRPPVMPTSKPAVLRAPSTRNVSVEDAPDNSVCQLYVEGGQLVAEGRLLKSKRVLHGRVVDADLVAVCLLSVRAGMHSYPYQNRFPSPSTQRSKLRMADVLQTSIVWSRAHIRVV